MLPNPLTHIVGEEELIVLHETSLFLDVVGSLDEVLNRPVDRCVFVPLAIGQRGRRRRGRQRPPSNRAEAARLRRCCRYTDARTAGVGVLVIAGFSLGSARVFSGFLPGTLSIFLGLWDLICAF